MIAQLIQTQLMGLALFAAPPQVTFSSTIAPILYDNCVTCHRPGNAAPFPLISYQDVRKRGQMIAAVTKSRYMPPWHAAHGYGEFKDERRLTDDEIAAIAEWVDAGMPEGDPSRMPPLPAFDDGWYLGKPDLVLEMPAAFQVPATGPDIFRNFAIPTRLTEDKWVRAIEFKPGAAKVVHHVLFAYDAGGAVLKLEGVDGKPGSQSGMAPLGLNGGGKVGGLGGWAVGGAPFLLPEGTAFLLPKQSDFVLQTHFHPSGKPESERSRVGIYFAEEPPVNDLFGIDLPALFGFGAGINVPAGKSDYILQDSVTLPIDVHAFGVAAHAHYVAKEMKAAATLPDGTEQPIIWIQDWDFNWQDSYTYSKPIVLPKGTRIDVQLRYDNSANNHRNPNNPPRDVLWGEQTIDEMASVNIFVTPIRKDEGPLLQKVLSERTQSAIRRGVQDGTLKRMQQQRAK